MKVNVPSENHASESTPPIPPAAMSLPPKKRLRAERLHDVRVREELSRLTECGIWVLGLGSRVLGLGSWVLGLGSWVLGLGSWVLG